MNVLKLVNTCPQIFHILSCFFICMELSCKASFIEVTLCQNMNIDRRGCERYVNKGEGENGRREREMMTKMKKKMMMMMHTAFMRFDKKEDFQGVVWIRQ